MAPLIASVSACFAFFLVMNFPTCSHSRAEAATHHVVSVQSLQPSVVCKSSKGSDPSRLQVAHLHGPCSPLKPHQKKTQKQILEQDQLRVDWLHSKANPDIASSATQVPARRGTYLGSGNYVVTVAFGSPNVAQTVTFDTGSDVTWIQCRPCVRSCYAQEEAIFDPSKSSTYTNVSCGSPYCSALYGPLCSGSTCVYRVVYGDSTRTTGFYGADTLSLTPSDKVPNFRFGCGEANSEGFGGTAGLLGLGRRASVSLPSQTYRKYGGVFSYCLPSTPSSTGYLSFGASSTVTSGAQYTPLLTYPRMPSFYFVELLSISVGGTVLPIPPSLFSAARTVLDSGTVITRLPPTAYAALRSAFQKGMSAYPKVPGDGLLDTCYDFSNHQNGAVPSVALNLRGADLNLVFSGIIYKSSTTTQQGCLAFAPNDNDSNMTIIGNTQQRTFTVIHDLARQVIGFRPHGC